MSDASKRGRSFEQEVAAILRKKLGARVMRDSRSGAGSHHKTDIKDYFQDLPFDIECKDQENIKVKEWMRQAIDASSFSRIPTLVFRMDEEIIAGVRFTDLVNLALEIADLRAEVDDLRKPIEKPFVPPKADSLIDSKLGTDLHEATASKIDRGAKECRGGHIADDWGYCMQLTCKYSRGYKPPKVKKK